MAVEDITTKRCTKCGKTKDRTEFHKMVTSRDGLRPDCKICHIATSSAYRAVNPAYNAAYYAANGEAERARCEAYRANNINRRRISDAERYLDNPGAYHTRRALKRGAGGVLSKGLAAKLMVLQKGKCPCCGKPLGKNYHMDHIMPLALGGSNTDDNIQLLRATCNNQKYTKHPIDFMQQRGFLL